MIDSSGPRKQQRESSLTPAETRSNFAGARFNKVSHAGIDLHTYNRIRVKWSDLFTEGFVLVAGPIEDFQRLRQSWCVGR